MRASHARQSHGTRPRLGTLAIGSLLVFGLAAVVTVAAIAAPAATTASRTGAANQIEAGALLAALGQSWTAPVAGASPCERRAAACGLLQVPAEFRTICERWRR